MNVDDVPRLAGVTNPSHAASSGRLAAASGASAGGAARRAGGVSAGSARHSGGNTDPASASMPGTGTPWAITDVGVSAAKHTTSNSRCASERDMRPPRGCLGIAQPCGSERTVSGPGAWGPGASGSEDVLCEFYGGSREGQQLSGVHAVLWTQSPRTGPVVWRVR